MLLRRLGALSDVCDADTARFLALEVSDGVIAPGYTDEALEILKTKRKGGYNVVEIDPDYEPAPIERRNIYGITFEQGYNSLDINEEMLQNIVTENQDLPQQAKHDMLLSPHHPEVHPVQLRVLCEKRHDHRRGGRPAEPHPLHPSGGQQGGHLVAPPASEGPGPPVCRQHPPPRPGQRHRPVHLDEYEDVLAEGVWQNTFKVKPEVLTAEEKAAWIAQMSGVTVGSDAFFPFGDNVERARKSGVQYIAQPGGSIRDSRSSTPPTSTAWSWRLPALDSSIIIQIGDRR